MEREAGKLPEVVFTAFHEAKIGWHEPEVGEYQRDQELMLMRLLLGRITLADITANLNGSDAPVTEEHVSSLSYITKVLNGAIDGHYRGIRSLGNPDLLRHANLYLTHERDILAGNYDIILFPEENPMQVREMLTDNIACDAERVMLNRYRFPYE